MLVLATIASVAGIAFVIRQRRAANPLYDLDIAARPTFWVAACAGIIVFGSLMGAMFIGQQFLQNVLDYSTFHAGLAILPAAMLMVVIAPRSASWSRRRGPLHAPRRVRVLLPRVPDDAPALEGGHPVLEGRTGVRPDRHRCGIRRHACVAFAHRVGARPACRDGVGHGRPATRPRRGDHAVDLRRLAHRRLRLGGDAAIADSPDASQISDSTESALTKSFSSATQPGQQLSRADPGRDHRRRQAVIHRRAGLGVHRRPRRGRCSGQCWCSSCSPATARGAAAG